MFSIALGEVALVFPFNRAVLVGVDVPDLEGEADGEEDERIEENPCGRAEVRRENVVRPVESERWSSWRPIV